MGRAQDNWGYCFVAGTKILMANGQEINIEDVKVGDEIQSVNMETMAIEKDVVVVSLDTLKSYERIEIKFDNDVVSNCSAHHPYFVKNKGWCVVDVEMAAEDYNLSVRDLKIGDIVFYEEKGMLKETKILEINYSGESVKMYNLKEVKNNNTFFADRILVHNRFNKN